MDLEKRLDLIKQVGEEIITEQELRQLLETNNHPVAYDGFEPSGTSHIAMAIFRAINLEDLIKAGVKFKLWLADWFAWINNKMGGDLEKIKFAGEYFIEVWKAAGVDMDKVDVLWASNAMDNKEYWKKVILVAKNTTLNRTQRAISIMGRTQGELKETSQLFYPMMQTADIFWLDVDICQLGLDQRRANILAREVSEKMKWKRPVVVSHHMIMGLQGVKQAEGYDENQKFDLQISSKMSKSKPETAIFIHDSKEDIKRKISNAFCPEKVVENNPVLEFNKYIIFRKMKSLKIERPKKFGGDLEINSYQELEKTFREGKLHPLDLKNATAEALEEVVKPVREHFEKNRRAKELYNLVKESKITR